MKSRLLKRILAVSMAVAWMGLATFAQAGSAAPAAPAAPSIERVAEMYREAVLARNPRMNVSGGYQVAPRIVPGAESLGLHFFDIQTLSAGQAVGNPVMVAVDGGRLLVLGVTSSAVMHAGALYMSLPASGSNFPTMSFGRIRRIDGQFEQRFVGPFDRNSSGTIGSQWTIVDSGGELRLHIPIFIVPGVPPRTDTPESPVIGRLEDRGDEGFRVVDTDGNEVLPGGYWRSENVAVLASSLFERKSPNAAGKTSFQARELKFGELRAQTGVLLFALERFDAGAENAPVAMGALIRYNTRELIGAIESASFANEVVHIVTAGPQPGSLIFMKVKVIGPYQEEVWTSDPIRTIGGRPLGRVSLEKTADGRIAIHRAELAARGAGTAEAGKGEPVGFLLDDGAAGVRLQLRDGRVETIAMKSSAGGG